MEIIKCNKSVIGKMIAWSSSRYNEWKKADVVTDIIFRVEHGEDCSVEYSSGCYSAGAHGYGRNKAAYKKIKWTGGTYQLVIKDSTAILRDIYSNEQVKIENPKKITLYTPAKRIRYTRPYDRATFEYDVVNQNAWYFYCYMVREKSNGEKYKQLCNIDKKHCEVI